MKNFFILVAISALASGCQIYQQPHAEAIKVELRGTPGMKFSGSYSIDGAEREVCGTVPMNIEMEGGSFSSVFRKEGDGTLAVVLNKNCRTYGEAVSQTKRGGVQAKISPGEVFDLTSITGF